MSDSLRPTPSARPPQTTPPVSSVTDAVATDPSHCSYSPDQLAATLTHTFREDIEAFFENVCRKAEDALLQHAKPLADTAKAAELENLNRVKQLTVELENRDKQLTVLTLQNEELKARLLYVQNNWRSYEQYVLDREIQLRDAHSSFSRLIDYRDGVLSFENGPPPYALPKDGHTPRVSIHSHSGMQQYSQMALPSTGYSRVRPRSRSGSADSDRQAGPGSLPLAKRARGERSQEMMRYEASPDGHPEHSPTPERAYASGLRLPSMQAQQHRICCQHSHSDRGGEPVVSSKDAEGHRYILDSDSRSRSCGRAGSTSCLNETLLEASTSEHRVDVNEIPLSGACGPGQSKQPLPLNASLHHDYHGKLPNERQCLAIPRSHSNSRLDSSRLRSILPASAGDPSDVPGSENPGPHPSQTFVFEPPVMGDPMKKTCNLTQAATVATGGFPATNSTGQRICRQCGQLGRNKDGKCIERWGPGPEGPGTVCDRCRKRMMRAERRSTLENEHPAATVVHPAATVVHPEATVVHPEATVVHPSAGALQHSPTNS